VHGARAASARIGLWVRRASYLQRWLALGAAIGVIAGLGAVAFYEALAGATHLLLGEVGGFVPPSPAGEGGGLGTGHFTRPWAIPLVVCLGGLLSGALVLRFAPEAEGHGTDAAIDAVHRNPRGVRARVVLIKLIASALTIGSGGSGGREGPTAQISAGFGSMLARRLDLSPEDGRIAVSVGIGSGIGAIFGAPLGGAVLAADIVYRDDFEFEALVPGLVASIIAYTVFGLLEGFSPLFGYAAAGYRFERPLQLVWFALIGAVAGIVGLAYAGTFYGVTALARRAPGARLIRPAAGGLAVGLLALALPQVLGTGYGWLQESLSRPQLMALPLATVLLAPAAKILATSLSIGTGGSGGIFGPGMVIGAFCGASIWRLLEPIAAGIPHSPAPFVVVGMMACFGSIARAPLAVMLMVAEMTGSLSILAPAMVAVGLAYLIVRHRDATIYRAQLRNRSESQAARILAGMPLLRRIRVADAVVAPRLVLEGRQEASEALSALERVGVPGAPVVDAAGRLLGAVTRERLIGAAQAGTRASVGRLADEAAPALDASATLADALEALSGGPGWVTVIDGARSVVGIVAAREIVAAYREAVLSEARQLLDVSDEAGIAQVQVHPGSPLCGASLRERPLGEGVVVVSLRRGDASVALEGAARLCEGDILTLLATRDRLASARRLAMPGA